MKKIAFVLLVSLTSTAFVAAADLASFVAAADPNLNPDGKDQNGNMVNVWTLTHSGTGTAPNNYGSFLGSSAQNGGGSGAGAGTSAWGIYANQPSANDFSNEVDIGHMFSGGALTINQGVSINFDAGYVDNGGSYGIRLYGPAGFTFALSFNGGDSTYRYYDSTTSGNSAGVGYDPNGFTFTYLQTGLATYTVKIMDGNSLLSSFSGTVSGAPDFIQVYDDAAGNGANYDVFANNLSIIAIPEPTSAEVNVIAALLLLAGFIYVRRARRGTTVS